ncbi:flavin reductase family protein [Streptomyces sp. bgisy159]|uniref:flavin reductase family protein n=1 Tax=Streptomyces sp. bgisy159 TaxID=3413795 RepID=UPI003F4A5E4F
MTSVLPPSRRPAELRGHPAPRPSPRSGPPASATAFRTLMSAFPTGVAVVTTYGDDGRPRGLTCSSLSSVAAEPPTLSVCLTTRGETLRALRAHGSFAVNLLHHGGQRAAQVFARPADNRFGQVAWRASPGAGLPWLVEDAFALAECTVSGLSEIADHTVVIGEVTGVAQESGVPLLYGARGFAAWPGGTVPGPLPAPEGVAS